MDQNLDMNDEYTKQYFKMLDDNRAYMYVVEPGTHKLIYANKALRELYGEENLVNQLCFNVLRGNRKTCAECPIMTVKEDKHGSMNSSNVCRGHHVFYMTSPIVLQGRELFLITALDGTEYHNKKVSEISLYHQALLHDALYYYVVDLTDNLILQKPLVNSTRAFPMKLTGKFPMNYDEYIRDWWGNTRIESNSVSSTYSKELLKLYEEGHHTYRVENDTKDGKYHISKVVLMSEDENTGHICASIIISDITEEYNRQKAAREELHAHQEYLQAFNSCFFTSIHYDLVHEKRILLSGGSDLPEHLDQYHDLPLQDWFELWVKNELSEEDQEEAIQYLRTDRIKDRLRVTNMISHDFNTRLSGWVCLQIVALRRDEEGEVTDIVCMTRTIDEAKQRELEAVRELRKKTTFANALSKTYFVSSHMDFVNDRVEIMNAGNYNYFGKKNKVPLRGAFEKWAKEDLDDTTRKEVEYIWNVDLLRKGLEGEGVVSAEIHTKTNGWVGIQAVALNRDENGEVLDGAWLCHVIDGNKKRELEAQQRVAAFARQYYCSYYIDMSDGTYVEMTSSKFLDDSFAPSGNAQEGFNYWARHILDEEYRGQVLEFVDLSTLEKRLQGHELISVEYVNGDNLWARGDFIPVNYDENGKLRHVIFAAKTIESEKRAALEAERSKQREYESVLAISKIYHTMHVVDVINDTYEEIWAAGQIRTVAGEAGVASESVARTVEFFCSEEFRERMRSFFDLSTLSDRMGSSSVISMEFMTVSGEWYRASFIVKERNAAGEVVKVLYTTQDIDADKQKELTAKEALQSAYEAAEKASAAKTVFLSNMSHDIRTPMNAITGFATIATNKIEDKERVKDCLKKILSSGEHLQSLINEILDMSRIESGKTQLEVSKTMLQELLNDVVPLIQPQIQAKQLHFNVETADVRDAFVWADTLKMRQIITNLLGNSIKFTPANGTITLRILQRNCNKDGYGAYSFIVKDTGIGMSEEFLEHVFEPFEREQSSTLSGVIGTGLGLSIAKNLVELMGGTISVRSKLGEGSEFAVNLEFALQTDVPEDSFVENANRNIEDILRGRQILLVEDNELNREIAVELLTDYGMQVDIAENGLQAVEKLQTSAPGTYEVVLMDIQMPIMNGYEAASEIRQTNRTDLQDIPIIAMTANAFVEDIQASRDAGMNDHLAKPLDLPKVFATLVKYLR